MKIIVKAVLTLCVSTVISFAISLKSADALTFNLNCILSNSDCTPSSSFGKIDLIDNGNNVDIRVELYGIGADNKSNKVLSAYLNFDDSLFSNSTNFNTTTGSGNSNIGVVEDENNTKVQGSGNYGNFDLKLPDAPPGEIGFSPYIDIITLANWNLTPSHFNFKDTQNLLFAAVHIGNYGPSGSSLAVGSRELPEVPEPASIILIGEGLLVFFFLRKRGGN